MRFRIFCLGKKRGTSRCSTGAAIILAPDASGALNVVSITSRLRFDDLEAIVDAATEGSLSLETAIIKDDEKSLDHQFQSRGINRVQWYRSL